VVSAVPPPHGVVVPAVVSVIALLGLVAAGAAAIFGLFQLVEYWLNNRS